MNLNLEEIVTVDDNLRPQTTFGYKKEWASKPYDFPNSYIDEPFPVKTWEPIDTYTLDHNARFAQRYSSSGKNSE